MTEKHRWSKFHWDDYENDLDLKCCSLAAQGLWMRLLCSMHRATPYGYLVIQGKPASLPRLAVLTGQPPDTLEPLMRELETAGVFSRTDEGVIFSRRLVRDRETYERDAENGRKGGNPNVRNHRKSKRKQGGSGGLTHPLTPSGDQPPPEQGVQPNEQAKSSGARNPGKYTSDQGVAGGLTPSEQNPLKQNQNQNQKIDSQGSTTGSLPICPRLTPRADDRFAEFWAVYPRRVAKGRAEKAFQAACKRASAADVIEGVRRYPFSSQPHLIPHPASWLNDRRWEDDVAFQRRAQADPARPDPGAWMNRYLGIGSLDGLQADEPSPYPIIDGELAR